MGKLSSLIWFCAITGALSGCVTGTTVLLLGRHQGNVTDVRDVRQMNADLLIEVEGGDIDRGSSLLLWTQVSKEQVFLSSSPVLSNVRFKKGPISSRTASLSSPLAGCLSSQKINHSFLLSDRCGLSTKTAVLAPGSSFDYRDPWRPLALPLVVPLAVAADIVLTPVYVGYLIKCQTFGCAK